MSPVVIFITAASRQEAERIGQTLLEERLAACVNLLPVDSAYWWQGRIERAAETLLIVKTAAARVARIDARVHALHSSAVPEIIAVPIVAGSAAYLRWIDDSVEDPVGG